MVGPTGNESLRILHAVESFGAGTQTIVEVIAGRLAAKGHEVVVAYGRRPETPRFEADAAGPVRQVALPWTDRRPWEHPRAALALRRLARSFEPDLVHLHSTFAGVVGSLACPRTVPVIYTPHGYSFLMTSRRSAVRRSYRLVESVAARNVSVIGAVSEAEATEARRVAGSTPVVAIPNGIEELDDPPMATAGVRAVPPKVVAVGRIGPSRRPREVARILSSLRDIGQAVWIGAEPTPGSATAALEAAGVKVTGWLDRQSVHEELATASALLHWSAWDGQATAILEAFAFDVPVIASDIPANRELLGPDQVHSDEREATSALRELLGDAAASQRAIDNQRARRGFYSAARMVSDWEQLYRELATAERPREPGQLTLATRAASVPR